MSLLQCPSAPVLSSPCNFASLHLVAAELGRDQRRVRSEGLQQGDVTEASPLTRTSCASCKADTMTPSWAGWLDRDTRLFLKGLL